MPMCRKTWCEPPLLALPDFEGFLYAWYWWALRSCSADPAAGDLTFMPCENAMSRLQAAEHEARLDVCHSRSAGVRRGNRSDYLHTYMHRFPAFAKTNADACRLRVLGLRTLHV